MALVHTKSQHCKTTERVDLPVIEAKVVAENGSPALYVNGKKTAPVLFFGNTSITSRIDVIEKEFQMAAAHGMHIHSIDSSTAWRKDQKEWDMSFVSQVLETTIENDPQALILLRFNVSIKASEEWKRTYPGESNRFVGDKQCEYELASVGSDSWFDMAKQMVEALVLFIMQHPVYSEHVIGYHIGADSCGEWFHNFYRENGVDISEASSAAFRAFLRRKYGNDERLASAWRDQAASLDTARIPEDLPGNDKAKLEPRTLLLLDSDQRYIDYHQYASDIQSSRIVALAAIIKQLTNGKSLAVFFYGYHFSLYDSKSGHFRLDRILDCEHIDALSSPIDYTDRNHGGAAVLMAPVDTIQAAGKLWFVENDLRTFLKVRTDSFLDPFDPVDTLERLIAVHRRDMGAVMMRGSGTWFMDLMSYGWLYHPDVWKNIAELTRMYEQYSAVRSSYQPEVALVVDEASMHYLAQPEQSALHYLYNMRFDLYRAGISFGLYTLDGILAMDQPPRVCLITNPYFIEADKAARISERLQRDGRTLVWMYGFGKTAESDVARIAGMKVVAQYGAGSSCLIYPAQSLGDAMGSGCPEAIGADVQVQPLYVVDDPGAQTLGRYEDGAVGFAVSDKENWTSVFFGGMRMDVETLQYLVARSGATVYLRSKDVFMTDGRLAVIHASASGSKMVSLPRRCDAFDWFEGVWYRGVDRIDLTMEQYETKYLLFGTEEEIGRVVITNKI